MNVKFGLASTLLLTTALVTHVQAETFTGNAIGSWQNPSATTSVYTISNTDNSPGPTSVASFDFGVPNNVGNSSNLFTFNGVGSGGTAGFTAASNTSFNIGAFTYRNGTTSGSSYPSGNSSVQLGIQLNLTSPIMSSSAFTYNLNIDITPNTGNPVTDADTVTIANGTTATTFTVGGQSYTLALIGFSQNGGSTFTNTFIAPEQTTTGADVYASITTNVIGVPEPVSLSILGVGLIGLAAARRRRRG